MQVDSNRDGIVTVEDLEADAARFFALLDRKQDGEIDPEDIEHYETVLAPEIRVAGAIGGPGMTRAKGGGGGGRGRRGGGGGGGGGGGSRGGNGGKDGGDSPSDDRAVRNVEGKRGAARFGYLDFPEPVTAADGNMNRGVDPMEFKRAADTRFALLDTNDDGKLVQSELPRIEARSPAGGGRRKPDRASRAE
jgi:Ca2+-binding EF-hand superfamily protein